jgi:hypothetical protein
VQLAGDPPDDPGNTPLDDPAPKIPKERSDTREGRMGFVRDAAQWVARNVGRYAPAVDTFFGALDQVEQIKALTDAIKSANDPAKTLEELQEPIGSPSQGGYHDPTSSVSIQGTGRGLVTAGLTAGKIRCGFPF